MKRYTFSEAPADYVSASKHRCALCAGNLIRTPRRAIDHLWNVFVPVQRYRCSRFSCQWVGNLRVGNASNDSGTVLPR